MMVNERILFAEKMKMITGELKRLGEIRGRDSGDNSGVWQPGRELGGDGGCNKVVLGAEAGWVDKREREGGGARRERMFKILTGGGFVQNTLADGDRDEVQAAVAMEL